MCEKGNFEAVNGIEIDRCLVSQVKKMWSLGITTLGCCCGHGDRRGFVSIPLKDAERAVDNDFVLLLPRVRMPDKFNKVLGVQIEK